MLTPPAGVSEDLLGSALLAEWAVDVAAMGYRAVGFGSHHWEVVDAGGVRWFLTVDELDAKRHSVHESFDTAFDRVHAALAAVAELGARGRSFVVAPVPTGAGQPLVRINEGFAAALYPFVDGQSFDWGEFATSAHRLATLELVIATHTAAPEAARRALADDFAVPHRDELEATLDGMDDVGDCGPYAHAASVLLTENAAPIRQSLARYDELVTAGRSGPSVPVLTHGEPHPGNTMLTAAGWRLIDWDTALVAPPERDLWSLDPGDGSVLAAYAEATSVRPVPAMLALYRIRWDLADLAVDVVRFRRTHTGTPDDDMTWELLRSMVAGIGGVRT